MSCRFFSAVAGVATFLVLCLLTAANHLPAAQGEKYNDPDTPKIRASFTIVPDTDDINELREFIVHTNENWSPHMRGRYKTYEDYLLFMYETAQAQRDAAEKILTIVREQGREENTNVDDNDEARKDFRFAARPKDNDTMFALKTQASSYGWQSSLSADLCEFWSRKPGIPSDETADAWWHPERINAFGLRDNPLEPLGRYEKFVESLERDPKRKDLAVYARSYWLGSNFQVASSLPDGQQGLTLYNKTFEQLKRYHAATNSDPLQKFFVSSLFFTQKESAEGIESSSGTSVKKGTLVIPVFEYYDSIFKTWDEEFLKQFYIDNWPNYYEREMTRYRILVADDPMAAFREAVEKLKESLEKELNGDSIQKVWALHGVAKDLDNRAAAQRLLYQTVRPIFAASSDPKVNDYVRSFDMLLDQLALIGEELELEAVLLDGTLIDLKDYRGKVVLLEYWATWCGPCIGEFPNMKAVYKTYRDRGFEIIALSVDEDLDALKAMVEKEELPWLNASEKLSLEQNLPDSREKYNINAYPTSILIGRDGKVIRANARGLTLHEELGKIQWAVNREE